MDQERDRILKNTGRMEWETRKVGGTLKKKSLLKMHAQVMEWLFGHDLSMNKGYIPQKTSIWKWMKNLQQEDWEQDKNKGLGRIAPKKIERTWKESKDKQLWKDRGKWTGLIHSHWAGLSKSKARQLWNMIPVNKNKQRLLHVYQKYLIHLIFVTSMISVFLLPRHGASSGCGWRNHLQNGW